MLTVAMQMSAEARCWGCPAAGYSGLGGSGGKHVLAPSSAPLRLARSLGMMVWSVQIIHQWKPTIPSCHHASVLQLSWRVAACLADGCDGA